MSEVWGHRIVVMVVLCLLLPAALPPGILIAFLTMRGVYGDDIGGKNYKIRHFFKELFHRYPPCSYGLRYIDDGDKRFRAAGCRYRL